MTRLGLWRPESAEDRLDRLESLAEIRQLPYRYALAIDSRDITALADLFVPDVRVGKDQHGREALKEWFGNLLTGPRTSVHLVGNHIIDFDAKDEARGIVYCRDELERPERGEWEIGVLQYWDTYRRVDGEWCIERRKIHRWYITDALTRPAHGLGVGTDGLATSQLPEAFPTWHEYWSQHPARGGQPAAS